MKIEIFDVELGQCAMIHCPSGKKLMIDAGHKSLVWWPSTHFYGQPIEELVISNFDEDHTSDIADVMRNCGVFGLTYNGSVTSTVLAALKNANGMGSGIKHIYEWMRVREGQPGGGPIVYPDLGGVSRRCFWSSWPKFTDTNNLSVATFVSYGGFTILFPGDLEIAGWRALLQKPEFQAELRKTTVLVASHHGRENGCCAEVFTYLNPMATIISDAGKQHSTQETVNWYASRTSGCKTRANLERKVFTTRSDGKITIDVLPSNSWYIDTSSNTAPTQTPALSAIAALGLPGSGLGQ